MRGLAVLVGLMGLACGARGASHAVTAPAATAETCVDADRDMPDGDPGRCIRDILDTLNRNKGKPISELLPKLITDRRPAVGALFSRSLQSSDHRDNPRLFFRIPCGYLTANLLGDSLEISIKRQKADPQAQPPGVKAPGRFSVGAGTGVFNPVLEGEMLLDLKPFPRDKDLTAAEVFNRYNPAYPIDGRLHGGERAHDEVAMETMNCTTCHADSVGYRTADGKQIPGSGAALGVRKVHVGQEEIFAIVSPQERVLHENAGGTQYCVPTDLRFVYDCSCAPEVTKRQAPACLEMRDWFKRGYQAWTDTQRTEACARLSTILRLQPRQNCLYDPRHAEDPKQRACYQASLRK